MTLLIIGFVFIGMLAGYFFASQNMVFYLDNTVSILLCLILFLVGIDIGRNKEKIVSHFKDIGINIIILPLSIIMGTLLGSLLASFITGLKIREALAVGAGFGWYSLSAIIISKIYSYDLGIIAFLSNVIREVLSILFIPLIAKHIGKMETIASAGATAMDTTLPLITKFTDSETAVLSFITGVILSSLVPVLIPIILGFS